MARENEYLTTNVGCNGQNSGMKHFFALLLAGLLLLPCAAKAAPSFPPSARRPISLPVDATGADLPMTLRGGTVNVSAGNPEFGRSLLAVHTQSISQLPICFGMDVFTRSTVEFCLPWRR